MKTYRSSVYPRAIVRQAMLAIAFALLLFTVAIGWAITPTQSTYDVWGGNNFRTNGIFYYDVDKATDYTKLGSTNRTATFYGNYDHFVVAVRKTDVLYLDAVQHSTGAYYNDSLATGNTNNTWTECFYAPDGRYTVLNGPAIGNSSSTYGAYGVFFRPSGSTSMAFIVYSPPFAPAITVQPGGQTVAAGGQITLTADAVGQAPLTRLWHKDGSRLVASTRRDSP